MLPLRMILLQLLASSVSKLLSSSLENPDGLQQVVAGDSQELKRTTVREAEAEGVAVAVAKEVAAHVEDMEEDRGGRGRSGHMMSDGVNISDVTRSFSDQEWASLSSKNRRHVHEERERRRTSDQGPAGEIHAATAASADTDRSSVTFHDADTC